MSRESLKFSLVLNKETHKWIKYRPNSFITLMDKSIGATHHGWTEFADSRDTASFHDLHVSLFKKPPAKSLTKDDISLYCWAHIVTNATDRLDLKSTEELQKKKSGVRGGPRTSLLGRKYRLKDPVGSGETLAMPPQAMVCLSILKDALIAVDDDQITEKELQDAVVEAAKTGRLVTRQDPWRIFQYYRPELMKAHLIAHD